MEGSVRFIATDTHDYKGGFDMRAFTEERWRDGTGHGPGQNSYDTTKQKCGYKTAFADDGQPTDKHGCGEMNVFVESKRYKESGEMSV
jgi:hypothetical protein